ncbi:hypothetical protein FJ960_14220 [Mesorhizobium sp. B2-3-11]|uniref:hypothetical protein n=1 Tax=Mesorhizobium sp. B2-3-11 TaxID=2589953 RepID=UPI0011271C1A|nr:hypothetical protein [Mesorhizobium sp. B2-3-11]TPM03637.1 hypothetical protein FJ960_14220 [Mesorhizobium sp. B2-3-11]
MPDLKKTHRLVKTPQISARYLADYMAASEIGKRNILTASKYQAIARVVQHDEAKQTISKFFRSENPAIDHLTVAAKKLRDRMADSDFDRDVFDHNADYLDRFAKVVHVVEMPDKAEILAPGQSQKIEIGGVKIGADLQFRLRRVTKTNKIKIGAGVFRYSKGKALKPEVGAWQSAFLLGYLGETAVEAGAEPEGKLCVTLDMYTGQTYPAPTDSVSRYKNMQAACVAISERWDNIKPPANAVF